MTDPNKQQAPNVSQNMNDDPDQPPPQRTEDMQERGGETVSGETTSEEDIQGMDDLSMDEEDMLLDDDQVVPESTFSTDDHY